MIPTRFKHRPYKSSKVLRVGVVQLTIALLFLGCAYILPATWRAFRIEPDDAAPAITRSLDTEGLEIQVWDPEGRRIVTTWITVGSGVTRFRERYVTTWERDDDAQAVTIYVRHEIQDRVIEDGRPAWSPIYHKSAKERAMLNRIEQELAR